SIMNEEPEPLTGLRSGVPMELEQVVSKALAKSPDERYQHVDEMLVDLKAVRKKLATGTKATISVAETIKPKISPQAKSRKFTAILSAMIIVLVALLALWWAQKAKRPAAGEKVAKKLAVLPFVNLTADAEQEYFCDGMTEQLITNLCRVPELKAIARTSVMRYKNTEKDVRQISKELDAKYVVEGSVRKSGKRVRITAQLIEAREGTHLWANDYDRQLEDIFAVQDDVSQSIAHALEVTFSKQTEEVVSASYPANVAAYDVYLKARHYIENVYLETKKEADFQHALKLAEQAVALDPEFAMGYLGLGYLYENHWIVTGDQHDLKQEEKYISRAYALNPRLPEANAALGYQFLRKGNFDKAFSFMKTALELNGNGWEAYHLFGLFCGFTGLYKQGIQYFSKAVELNPLNIHTISNRGWYWLVSGDFQSALQDFEKGYVIQPDHVPNLNGYAFALMMLEQSERADKILSQAESLPPGAFGNRLLTERALYYAATGQRKKALSTSQWGGVLAALGMKKEALDFIDNATRDENGDYFLLTYLPLIHLPIYDSLRTEPRFQKIVSREKEKYEIRLKKYSIPIID
ncbi:MAG: hypothetical protein ACE5HO_21790, partial [bacterium]